ncbi:MAG: hypothetical protein A2365_00725 [Candidatus Nealsonbacteria bacterium RIFOXYB1_FULL_40_15]|uniref:Uncharacterized protein n=2 Tax=Candidatus Nealsoniibacteriota TaxID=1817911 RepID=A0A1G2ESP9_9BACT|nr:MAG: hypothetical protein A2365_00725 [Candidatus Nealsonbacteria bacterium RIFOXYB1_FULL_40_15]OGZ28512.1 MAG: hypothetical protein A2562_03415 [Candidatus Nealsonbacteria bacterium RIFOXYD1_FULL_39_11]OGZ28793.1 MAG: hypothetical protein A2427_01910 [Candidatus Nealsonbacteria bacterium RIFOXYC1_FULL_40_7]
MSKAKDIFSKIYDDNIERIYRFIFFKVNSKDIAEDICSEVFLRGWQTFKQNSKEIENPSAFLYQIARNLVIDHYREKGRTPTVSSDSLPIVDSSENMEEAVFMNSDLNMVKMALSDLKDEYQEIIVWHYIDEYTVPEIAELMGKSEGAVRVQLHRALKSLKNTLDNKVKIA